MRTAASGARAPSAPDSPSAPTGAPADSRPRESVSQNLVSIPRKEDYFLPGIWIESPFLPLRCKPDEFTCTSAAGIAPFSVSVSAAAADFSGEFSLFKLKFGGKFPSCQPQLLVIH